MTTAQIAHHKYSRANSKRGFYTIKDPKKNKCCNCNGIFKLGDRVYAETRPTGVNCANQLWYFCETCYSFHAKITTDAAYDERVRCDCSQQVPCTCFAFGGIAQETSCNTASYSNRL